MEEIRRGGFGVWSRRKVKAIGLETSHEFPGVDDLTLGAKGLGFGRIFLFFIFDN